MSAIKQGLLAACLGKYRFSLGLGLRKDQGELANEHYMQLMVDQSVLDPVRASLRLNTLLLRRLAPQQQHLDTTKATWTGTDADVAPEDLVTNNKVSKSLAMFIVGQLCHKFMHLLTSTTIAGREHFIDALERPTGTPMISICNHVCAMDDPIVLGAIVPTSYLLHEEKIRWTLCASDRCYKYAALTGLFRAFKTIPVDRGRGLWQPGMQAAVQRLDQGDWVHVFPEGTRTKDGNLGPTRQGVAVLIAECEHDPLVVPFVHRGMEHVMPRKTVIPRPGNKVDVLVGEPISFADLRALRRSGKVSQAQQYTLIQERVHYYMHRLHAQLFDYPFCEELPALPSPPTPSPLARHLDSFPAASLGFGPSFLAAATAWGQHPDWREVWRDAWRQLWLRAWRQGEGGLQLA